MADVSEIMKLKPKDLKNVQAIFSFLHLLGLTDEQIKLIPEILKNWPTIVKNMNEMVVDLASLKQGTSKDKPQAPDDSAETPDNIKNMIGFNETAERVNFSELYNGGKR